MPRNGRPKLTGLPDPDWLDPYFGLSAQECEALAKQENRPIRVILPGYAVTEDWVEERLNVVVDHDHNVQDIYMG